MIGLLRKLARSEPVLSEAAARDAAAFATLHAAAFRRGWSEDEFERLLLDRSVIAHRAMIGTLAGRALAGFILSRRAGGEAEILSVAVAPMPFAKLLAPVADALPPFAKLFWPVAVAEPPFAVLPWPVAVAKPPFAVLFWPVAVAKAPFATLAWPVAVAEAPIAVLNTPVAVAWLPFALLC